MAGEESHVFWPMHEQAGVGKPPDPVTEKFYQDVKNSIVQIGAGNTSGSGFAIGHDEIVTNAHVALKNDQVFVRTPLGNLNARISKVDVANDLVVLSVPGLEMSGISPLPMDAKLPSTGDAVYAYGHPGCRPETTISPGIVQEPNYPTADSKILLSILDGFKGGWQLVDLYPDRFAELSRAAAARTWIHSTSSVMPGSSGGPLGDGSEKAIGVITREMGCHNSLAVPIEAVKALEESPSKFRFQYSDDARLTNIEAIKSEDRDEAALLRDAVGIDHPTLAIQPGQDANDPRVRKAAAMRQSMGIDVPLHLLPGKQPGGAATLSRLTQESEKNHQARLAQGQTYSRDHAKDCNWVQD